MKIKKIVTSLLSIALGLTILYGAASHSSGPIVSGTKAQGDAATVATGEGDIFAADAIESEGNLEVGGSANVVGSITAASIVAPISGAVTGSTITASGYLAVAGTASVTGATSLGSLSITGYADVKTQLDNIATSTNTEVTARTNADLSLGLATATLQTNITNGDLAIGVDTGTLSANKLENSSATATYFPLIGAPTISGNPTFSGNPVFSGQPSVSSMTSFGTFEVNHVIQKYLLVSDSTTITFGMPSLIYFSTGVFAEPGCTWNMVLPTASPGSAGNSFTIMCLSANNILDVSVSGGGTINGASNYNTIDAKYDNATFTSVNSEWVVTSSSSTP